MSKHLWYFAEELVALSFFDDAVSFETKQHIIAKLQDEDDEQKFLKIPQHLLSFLKDKNFQEFVIAKANSKIHFLKYFDSFQVSQCRS